jgi:SAM-dependent methyltransferase
MGVDRNTANFLFALEKSGVSFRQTLTISRHQRFFSANVLAQLLRQYRGLSKSEIAAALESIWDPYADKLFKFLGAESVESMDYSSYEGAGIIHDLNLPIPDALKLNYDVVFDAGTLEHVFNFPVAIRNCMELLKVGGSLVLHTPANNYFGHGFYQFSPELYFRVLSEENGFRVERIFAVESHGSNYDFEGRWFEVADPKAVRSRVQLINNCPVLLFVLARKIAQREIFAKTPLQSDYVAAWQQTPLLPAKESAANNLRRQLKQRLSPKVLGLLRNVASTRKKVKKYRMDRKRAVRLSFRNTQHYRRVNDLADNLREKRA